jgi:hypothetical protein
VIRSPVVDLDRFERIWQQVAALSGAYTMNPNVASLAAETRASTAKHLRIVSLVATPPPTPTRPAGM